MSTPAKPDIGIVDYGVGNVLSVAASIERNGGVPRIIRTPAEMGRPAGLILPGVGAFGAAVRALQSSGLGDSLAGSRARGIPMLGICLGMQVMFEDSEESPGATGLSLFKGRVTRLVGVRLPHVGYNSVQPEMENVLLQGVPAGNDFYFSNSYGVSPDACDPRVIAGSTEYGDIFVSAVDDGECTMGVQFHPELSKANGDQLLRNFLVRVSC